jgi:hypothetical protein
VIMLMIETLNRIHKADPTVLPKLIDIRVPCNKEVADDPTVQVDAREGQTSIGVLGLLNGIAGDNKQGIIYAIFDDENKLTHFMQAH